LHLNDNETFGVFRQNASSATVLSSPPEPLPEGFIDDTIRMLCWQVLTMGTPNQVQLEAIRTLVKEPAPSLKLILKTAAEENPWQTHSQDQYHSFVGDRTKKIKAMTKWIQGADEIKKSRFREANRKKLIALTNTATSAVLSLSYCLLRHSCRTRVMR
jgi:hypothetical protein